MRRGSLRSRRLHHAGVFGKRRPAGRRPARGLADSCPKVTPVNCSHFNPPPAGGPPPYTGLHRTPPWQAFRHFSAFFGFETHLENALAFNTPFRQLLTPTWSQNPAKTEPKPSQNPVQNAPKFDVKLRTPKSESEQTLPHFSSFLLIPNAPKSA